VEGLGNGMEEGVLFGIAGNGRTVEVGYGGGDGVLRRERCVEGGGEEILDRLFDLGLLGGRLSVLSVCLRWM